MKKFLLSLGLIAVIASPAAAGRLDDDADPTVREDRQPQTAQRPDVDYTTTRSIQRDAAPSSQTDGSSTQRGSTQRGDQGAFFGANGH